MTEFEAKLDFWIKNKLNVLLIGKSGVGKTTLIKKAFQKANLNLKYFSAPTMDPWIDLVGVPKETQCNGQSCIEIIPPKTFIESKIDCVFFDEYNRAKDKVKDGCLEFMQFGTINGRSLGVTMVWAAINPSDDPNYSVEALDQAQKDRFHIKYYMPYEISVPFFVEKFGEKQTIAVTEWWNKLDEKIKDITSPRCVEYALNVYNIGGDIRDVLPKESNVSKLLTELKSVKSTSLSLKELYESKDEIISKQFLMNENNFRASLDEILEKEYYDFFFSLLSEERQMMLLSDKKIRKFVFQNPRLFLNILYLYEKNNNDSFAKKIKKEILEKRYFTFDAKESDLEIILDAESTKKESKNAKERILKYKIFETSVPIKFKNPTNIEKLLSILINDLYFPSSLLEINKMSNLSKMICHLSCLRFNNLKDFMQFCPNISFLDKWNKENLPIYSPL